MYDAAIVKSLCIKSKIVDSEEQLDIKNAESDTDKSQKEKQRFVA